MDGRDALKTQRQNSDLIFQITKSIFVVFHISFAFSQKLSFFVGSSTI
jgi:hypothetical protein